ncbi:MAG TPA: thiamine phosphate synthase [Methylomirabilota bacterium]|nr:thiamine phosphate synthase [Methylomirabilota bacterium]
MLDFRLYFVTDRQQTNGRPLVDVVHAALDGGVRAVQVREKDLEGGELYRLAAELRRLTAHYKARLFINDRIDVALAVDADGVHLGQTSFPVAIARQLIGSGKLLGVSTHSQAEIEAAARADFIVFGPVYFTPSKAAYGEPQGVDRLSQAVTQSAVPVIAIGGIKSAQIPEVLAAGAHGIAVISAISAAPDPAQAARDLLAQLPGRRN